MKPLGIAGVLLIVVGLRQHAPRLCTAVLDLRVATAGRVVRQSAASDNRRER